MAADDVEADEDPEAARVLAAQFADLVERVGKSGKAATLLRVSPNTVNKWVRGKAKIPFLAVLRLSQELDLSLDRFAIGGEETAATARHGSIVQTLGSTPPEGYVAVPTFDVRASAGGGAIAVSVPLEQSDVVAFREPWLRSLGLLPGRVHVLWASGDSMTPTIRDGDMLLVDRTIDRVVNDGIYIVVVGGAVVVKRIQIRHNGAVSLKSDNTRYDEQTIPADEVPSLIIEGRVRWVGGPI